MSGGGGGGGGWRRRAGGCSGGLLCMHASQSDGVAMTALQPRRAGVHRERAIGGCMCARLFHAWGTCLLEQPVLGLSVEYHLAEVKLDRAARASKSGRQAPLGTRWMSGRAEKLLVARSKLPSQQKSRALRAQSRPLVLPPRSLLARLIATTCRLPVRQLRRQRPQCWPSAPRSPRPAPLALVRRNT